MLEINVSCPNVKEGAIAFGQDAECLYDITAKIKEKARQPIIMKLSPNVTDIAQMARAAEAAGADAISLTLEAGDMVSTSQAHPGQFVHIKCGGGTATAPAHLGVLLDHEPDGGHPHHRV